MRAGEYATAAKQHGSVARAARAMGVAKSTFYSRLQSERKNGRVRTRGPRGRRATRVDVTGALGEQVRRSARSHWYNTAGAVAHDHGGRMELERLPETVLAFSCMQAPYHHPDTIPFLATVKAAYAASFSICLGDELDLQFLKKQFMGADSMGPVAELERGKEFVEQLGRIFPQLCLLTSNHVHGRVRYAGAQGNVPSAMLRPWEEIIAAPRDWMWRDYLIMRDWLFEHGHDINRGSRGSLQEETMQRFGRPLSIMRGHVHSQLGDYIKPIWIAPDRQMRLVYVGCLMDPRQVTYTRAQTVNGCVVLIRGVPHPIPMVTDKFGRWIGKLSEW